MKSKKVSSADLLEERLELRKKLHSSHVECDLLRDRLEETMKSVRGLEISLRCAEKGRDGMEARLKEITGLIESAMEEEG